MKVKVTRFECFFVSAKWKKEQKAYFHLDLTRDGSKAEKDARKELARLFAREKDPNTGRYSYRRANVEGIGFAWRVEASIIAKYAHLIELPCSIQEEIARYQREVMIPPEEPLLVGRIVIEDLEKPHIISLRFVKEPDEGLRRALDQYLEEHWQARDDWVEMRTRGASISITRGILQVFLSWFAFAEPFGDMLDAAMEAAKVHAEERKRWEEGAEERSRQWEEAARHAYSQYYREYRPTYTLPLSELESALEIFSLSRSMATKDTVKARYRTLSKLYHPDTGGNEEDFKRLNSANQILVKYFT